MTGTVTRILVVDDDPGLVRMVKMSLEVEGYDVVTASDGERGLEELDKQPSDIVLLDLQMPRMDGRTFYKEMKSRGFDIPVLILSAYGAEAACLELDADAAVNKPFDPDFLTETVKRIIDGRD
jgi:DNA-binding response OmpR family regulator